MKLLRLVLSDLHLSTGIRRGELNPLEDFVHDDRFVDLLRYYDSLAGPDTEIELILNGDIFDLLKVKIDGSWPLEITEPIAAEKLRKCLDGHPRFVRGLREFLAKDKRRLVYLPGNHDLDMWLKAPQELFRRYVAPGARAERVRFITENDTYYLPEGIQIRHGHQLERIHRVDYAHMTRQTKDGAEVLVLPWGSIWILEVMNPAKEQRNHIDRVQPFRRFLLGALLFDSRFAIRFLLLSTIHFIRHRIFTIHVWKERLRNFTKILREEIFSIGTYDESATKVLQQLRGVHTLIVGHSHGPRFLSMPQGKVLVNTGTWIRMINVDLQHLGQNSGLTYAIIEYDDEGQPRTSLMRWYGQQVPCEAIPYAD
ncbi:MAG: metallophosphoesterase [Myxococcales bacterium]|nr:metallophosphoesterase [Myxococcales bacterium]MCB9709276.1 metallophosphoesterase [Myxococcales bacterium]